MWTLELRPEAKILGILSEPTIKGLFGKNNLRARLFPDYLLGIS
jgi:hypothetical protein